MAILKSVIDKRGFCLSIVEANKIVSTKKELIKRKKIFVVTLIPPPKYKKKNKVWQRSTIEAANNIFNTQIEKNGIV